MDAYETILAYLRLALKEAGGNKAELTRRLQSEPSRSTVLKAVDAKNPVLPGADLLCRWIDRLGLQISKPRPKAPASVGEGWLIRLLEVDDLLEPPEAWPDRGSIMVPSLTLERRRLDADALVAVEARRGMPPTVCTGDLVLIDVSDLASMDAVDGCIHALDYGGQIHLRRIQHTPDGHRLTSDTQEIAPVDIPYGSTWPCAIVGRVVGCLHLFE